MPRVSIITATYNRSEVLRYAIDSVRRQTYTDWEHIIVGDACTDDTDELVRSYGDPRLRFLNRAENFGEQSVPNNDGLAMASGELIAYLNHDDLWFPDHLESLTTHLDTMGADLTYAPLVEIDASGVPRCGPTHKKMCYDPSHFVPASLWLVRRSLAERLRGWRPARQIHASNPSQDFLVRAWRKTKRIECVPKVSALVLSSGGRPGAYVSRDASQHAQTFNAMAEPGFREQLLTRMVLEAGREVAWLRSRDEGWSAVAGKAADRLMVVLRLHPNAVRNRLSGRPKGHWITYLRRVRGLPASPAATKTE